MERLESSLTHGFINQAFNLWSDSLAGEETLTGSSMYAGSPGPHLLQAVTLNRYSFPSTTSVTVNS